eukprot:TCALIF_04788-PA protein Name:"Protein of unknown function" AED:0.29 eAED:0.31 QI:0/-1/0/1/-1/1/1/0/467
MDPASTPRIDRIDHFNPSIHGPRVGQALQEWLRYLELFYRANYLHQAPPAHLKEADLPTYKDQAKRDVLLWAIGPHVQDDIETKLQDPTANEVSFADVATVLKKAYKPASAPHRALRELHLLKQEPDEDIGLFLRRCRKVAERCGLEEPCTKCSQCTSGCLAKHLAKFQAIEGASSTTVRMNAVDQAWSYDTLVAKGRTLEDASTFAADAQHGGSNNANLGTVHKVGAYSRSKRNQAHLRRPTETPTQKHLDGRSGCYGCGERHGGPRQTMCPAYGTTCASCGKIGHYAKVCLGGRRVHTMSMTCPQPTPAPHHALPHQAIVDHSDPEGQSRHALTVASAVMHRDPSMGHIFTVSHPMPAQPGGAAPQLRVSLGRSSFLAPPDTGADLNVVPLRLLSHHDAQSIRPAAMTIIPFGAAPFRALGKLQADTIVGDRIASSVWYVVDDSKTTRPITPLIGCSTALDLGVV